jgi:hypothetical protein
LASPPVSLSLASTRIGSQGFQFLEIFLQQLTAIDVSDCFLGSEAIVILADHMPRNLKVLHWNNNTILPLHLSLLISHLPSTLKRIELRKTRLRSESVAELVDRLFRCPYLEHVSLSRNPISTSVLHLVRLFDHPSLECLCITDIGNYDQHMLIHRFASNRFSSMKFGNPMILTSQKLVIRL